MRDDALNLQRLGESLRRQTKTPTAWVIVDDGSTDETPEVTAALAAQEHWITEVRKEGREAPTRGAPIADAFEVGLARLRDSHDVVARVDADVSMASDFFARLLVEFERDPSLGVASGSRLEHEHGEWRRRFVTGGAVEAQCRAYRFSSLVDLVPFDRHRGWDGVDVVRAQLSGWRTLVVRDLLFRHHRAIGARDGSRLTAWIGEGIASYSMGYRPLYLLARSLYRMSSETAAVGLLLGYVVAFVRREPRASHDVRRQVRREQGLRRIGVRRREAQGSNSSSTPTDVLLIADPGGHLYELAALNNVWSQFSHAWVTVDGADVSVLTGERVFYARGPTRRNVKNFVRNAFVAVRLIRRLRPRVIVATGAGLAVPFLWVGRLLGVRVLFLECSGRVDLSLSGRLVAPIVHRLYVQWPEAVPLARRAVYLGSVFFSGR